MAQAPPAADRTGMPAPHTPHSGPARTRLGRFGALALLVILFAGAASILGPFASSAGLNPEARHPVLLRPDGSVLIGRIVGRDRQLVIYTSPSGATYTVTDSRGRILAQGLPAADLYRDFPDLDPSTLRSGPDQPRSDEAGGSLMMVDPDR